MPEFVGNSLFRLWYEKRCLLSSINKVKYSQSGSFAVLAVVWIVGNNYPDYWRIDSISVRLFFFLMLDHKEKLLIIIIISKPENLFPTRNSRGKAEAWSWNTEVMLSCLTELWIVQNITKCMDSGKKSYHNHKLELKVPV